MHLVMPLFVAVDLVRPETGGDSKCRLADAPSVM
jgi:hypothetical protein